MKNDFSFCASEVKNNDYYRFLCCLFTPAILRERLFTLYAFNFEISKIKDIVSEPIIGHIRIAWWREAIDEIYENKPVRQHEILKALSQLIKETDLPKEMVVNIIDAHENEIEFVIPKNLADLERLANETSTTLLEASLYLLGQKSGEGQEIAQHIGIAYGLVEIMRFMRVNASNSRLMLPEDLLAQQGITTDEIYSGKNLGRVKPIVKEIYGIAENHLKQADVLRKKLRKEAVPIYLHSVIASSILNRIRKNDYDLFHSNLEENKANMLIRLFYKANLFNRYAHLFHIPIQSLII